MMIKILHLHTIQFQRIIAVVIVVVMMHQGRKAEITKISNFKINIDLSTV